MAEFWQSTANIAMVVGFVVTWLVGWTAFVYSRGKVDGRQTTLEKRVEDIEKTHVADMKEFKIDFAKQFLDFQANITADIDELFRSFKDSDGDIKYLTHRRHSDICAAYQKTVSSDTDHIKTNLAELKSSMKSIQNSLLVIATSRKEYPTWKPSEDTGT